MSEIVPTVDVELSVPQLRARVRGYELLHEIARDLAATIDPLTILESVTNQGCHILGCERASLFQHDAASAELYTRVTTALEIEEIRHPDSEGISGEVLRTGQTVHVPDPAADHRWGGQFDRATGFTTRNLLAVPLRVPHSGRMLGVLEFLNKRDGGFDSFDEELATALGQHAAVALERVHLVATVTSLNVAREVQRGFMPHTLPAIEGYESASWWFPNEAVGGDYCDLIPVHDGRVGLIIADVAGHGLGPALLMASVRAGLRALLLNHTAPEVLLSLLGLALGEDLKEDKFITMVYAALDPQRHTVQFANAGHAPAIQYRRQSRSFITMEATGLPLGVLDRPEYPQGPPLALEVGDLIVLCTDGIVEAMDEDGRQFGIGRLYELIDRHADDPVQEIVQSIGDRVTDHYIGDAPPDDLTILAVRRNR